MRGLGSGRKLLVALAALVLCSCQSAQAAGFGFSGFGYDRHQPKARGGTGGAVIGVDIAAPALAQTSSAGASPFTWDETLGATVYAGYNRRLQVATDSGFSSVTEDLTKQITESEMAGNPADWSLAATNIPPPYDTATHLATQFTSWSGVAYMRERVERDDGLNSPWSNTISDTIAGNQSRYWRIAITTSALGTFTGIGEIEYRTTIGSHGSAVAPTGVAVSSFYTSDPTYAGSKAIDGTTAGFWFSNALPATLDATFASAIESKEIVFTGLPAGNEAYAPKDFKLQKCPDATFTSCTDYLTETNQINWTTSEVRPFH